MSAPGGHIILWVVWPVPLLPSINAATGQQDWAASPSWRQPILASSVWVLGRYRSLWPCNSTRCQLSGVRFELTAHSRIIRNGSSPALVLWVAAELLEPECPIRTAENIHSSHDPGSRRFEEPSNFYLISATSCFWHSPQLRHHWPRPWGPHTKKWKYYKIYYQRCE